MPHPSRISASAERQRGTLLGPERGGLSITSEPFERRQFLRTAYMAQIDACLDGEALRLFVYDLSMDGCMIESRDDRISIGDMLALQFDEHGHVAGRVLWRKNRNAGVKFTERLSSEAVRVLLAGRQNLAPGDQSSFDRNARREASRAARGKRPPAF